MLVRKNRIAPVVMHQGQLRIYTGLTAKRAFRPGASQHQTGRDAHRQHAAFPYKHGDSIQAAWCAYLGRPLMHLAGKQPVPDTGRQVYLPLKRSFLQNRGHQQAAA